MSKRENKKLYHFRFHEEEYSRWKNIAKKLNISLTKYIEKKLNQDDKDPHIFI